MKRRSTKKQDDEGGRWQRSVVKQKNQHALPEGQIGKKTQDEGKDVLKMRFSCIKRRKGKERQKTKDGWSTN